MKELTAREFYDYALRLRLEGYAVRSTFPIKAESSIVVRFGHGTPPKKELIRIVFNSKQEWEKISKAVVVWRNEQRLSITTDIEVKKLCEQATIDAQLSEEVIKLKYVLGDKT